MRKFGVVPLRFGRAASGPIERNFDLFYRTLALAFDGANSEFARNDFLTIPLNYDMLSDAELTFRLMDAYVDPWILQTDFVIIDLANPADQLLANHHLLGSVAEIVRKHGDRGGGIRRRFLVLLPTLIPPSDITIQPLLGDIEKGAVALLSDSGAIMHSPSFGAVIDSKRYVSSVRAARGSPTEICRKKLIRFPGHFKRYSHGIHNHCTAYYFDGRLCQAELVDMIDEYVSDKLPVEAPYQIFFHATISSWLESAAVAFGKRRNFPIRNLEGLADQVGIEFGENVLIILPLLDTGDTISKLHRLIRAKNKRTRIQILTVLTTGDRHAGPSSFELELNAERLSVDYFLNVRQKRFDRGKCPLCADNIPESDPREPDPYVELSTHAFWTLGLNLGFGPEENVPAYREAVGYLPLFKAVGDDDGPYLAYKIDKLLRSTGRLLPATPIILCPSEDGASTVANWLEYVFGMTVIRIPREGIDYLTQVGCTPHVWLEENQSRETWVTQLQSIVYIQNAIAEHGSLLGPSGSSVIILDEINVSGKTRAAFAKVAKSLGLDILSCVSIIDLSSGTNASGDCPLSLYSVEVPIT